MSANEGEIPPQDGPRPSMRPEDAAALWWLARWLGIPFLLVIALYYMEPLFRANRIDVVPAVTRQEVHPYPFPPGAKIAPLAPPEVPRAPKPAEAPPVPVAPDVSPADIVATPIDQPKPEYPQRALEAEKEGIVRLRITIAPDGSVSDAMVVDAQPKGWFDAAARNAVMRWRYRPSGRTIETEVEIEFKLK